MGKQLPANIYELITYIEANTLDEDAQQHLKKRKVLAERAKILRETRLIPKVIMVIEDFNKHVILLSKKTKTQDRLTNYLHLGTMRDFDIKSTDLKAAIERSLSDGRNISQEDSNDEEDQEEDALSNTYPEENEESEEEPEAEPEEVEEPVVVEKSQRRRRVPSTESEDTQPKRKRGRPANKEPPSTSSKSKQTKKDSKEQPTKGAQEATDENKMPKKSDQSRENPKAKPEKPAAIDKPQISRRLGLVRSKRK